MKLPKKVVLNKISRFNGILVGEYYEFDSFQRFANKLNKTNNKQDLIKYYSNKIIVIDEVQNIRLHDDSIGINEKDNIDIKIDTYKEFHQFLHLRQP